MNDQDHKFRPKREEMVSNLRGMGISNERVLDAFRSIKRHLFVDSMFWDSAYQDSPLPILANQTISQPYTVAYMTSIVAEFYSSRSKVLEIGTGSGYQAAILAALGYRVFSIERHESLFHLAAKRFEELGVTVAQKHGDGTLGWASMKPFDAILVTAGSPDVPRPLLEQLGDNGRLIIPIGDSKRQRMSIFHRQAHQVVETVTDDFAFVPLIGKEGWRESH
jgi:protein-L-isoaspartate(D-aspartate) O-methyltransferase